jgi:hypothetical protein
MIGGMQEDEATRGKTLEELNEEAIVAQEEEKRTREAWREELSSVGDMKRGAAILVPLAFVIYIFGAPAGLVLVAVFSIIMIATGHKTAIWPAIYALLVSFVLLWIIDLIF